MLELVDVIQDLEDSQLAELKKMQVYDFHKINNKWQSKSMLLSNEILQGKQKIIDSDIQKLKAVMDQNLKLELAPGQLTPFDLAQLRQNSPITKEAIRGQSNLQKAIREGKGWAIEQSEIIPENKSVNEVYKLDQVAFFKVGQGGEKAAGTMETLIWEFAVIMGLEEQFVPTGETKISTAGPIKAAMQWSRDGALNTIGQASKSKEGSIQPTQEGMLLQDYINNRESAKNSIPTIERSELMKAGLTSITFGMWDAHLGNIFVSDGRLKFFDNTRSLPNSNGAIKWKDYAFKPTFRSGLFALNESYETLTTEERRQMLEMVKSYKTKVQNLHIYINSPQGKQMLEKLPPEWFNKNGVLTAMQERLDLMELTLASAKSLTLSELMIDSNPGYRFYYALALANDLIYADINPDDTYLQSLALNYDLHLDIGIKNEETRINVLASWGVDIELVKKLSEDHSLTTEMLIKEISKHVKQAKTLKDKVEFNRRSDIAAKMITSLSKQAVRDNKDISRNESEKYAKDDSENLALL